MDSMGLFDSYKKVRIAIDRKLRVMRMRWVLDSLGVVHQLLSDEQLQEWMAKIDLTPQKPVAKEAVRSEIKPPPIIVMEQPTSADVHKLIVGLAERYPISIEALEDILMKCRQDINKLETVLILMAKLFKSDDEVLERYDTYIKTYENFIAKAKHYL